MESSRLFQRFRALGLVTEDIPIVLSPMGKENFFTVSIGRSFQVFQTEKLIPVLVSPLMPSRIRALEAKNGVTFTACGKEIFVWDRIVQRGTLKGHSKPISQLLSIGSVLLSLAEDRSLCVWNTDTMSLERKIMINFDPVCMMHPPTYLNKVLVASNDGKMILLNIRTEKVVYEFQGWNTSISTITESPAVDVVGIGLSDGRIIMHNLKYDKTVITFKQNEGHVSCISFRSDSSKIPMVATGSESGDISIWNLKDKRLEFTIPQAHDGNVVSSVFLPNQPILITSGADNSIKMWIFDKPDGSCRLLKSRDGHRAPPTRVRYYGGNTLSTMADGADGTSCQLLSAGQDRAFRVFHTAREQQSREMSQGPLLKKAKKLNMKVSNLKLPPITQFASVETRSKDWANVVTCHEDDPSVYVWQFDRRAIGKHVLRQFNPSIPVTKGSSEYKARVNSKATSVAISICGNFALVGTLGGSIFKYNMQSGEKRGSYPTFATPKPELIRGLTLKGLNSHVPEDFSESDSHTGAVHGLAIDGLNQTLISGSLDGSIKFWDFSTHKLLETITVGSKVSQLEVHRDSNLLAVVCDDQVIRVYDITTRKLVRRFMGHTHRVTDVAFSNDSRWLYSCSGDNTVRVWDLPTGRCVDWVRFENAVTGISVSPTGEFIATTHVGSVGIYLWANKSFFASVFLDQEPKSPVNIGLPAPVAESGGDANLNQGSEFKDEAPAVEGGNVVDESTSLDLGGANAIVLSTAPRALWHTLFNLELIKQRNKPVQPPKAPEKAPFFLPTIRKDEVNPSFEPDAKNVSEIPSTFSSNGEWKDEEENEETDNEVEADSESRLLKSSGSEVEISRCILGKLLLDAVSDDSRLEMESTSPSKSWSRFSSVLDYLQSLSASAIDLELSGLCLGDHDVDGHKYLELFLSLASAEISSRRDFQVVQAYLNRFLKIHGDTISGSEQLLRGVKPIFDAQRNSWQHLQGLLHQNMCMIQYFSKLQM